MGIPTDLEKLVGGFNPSEQYESQLGLFPIYGKIKKMFQTTNQDGIFGFSPAKRNVVFATHPAFSKHRGVCFLRRKTWRNNGETLFWYYVDIMLINILPNIIST